MSNKILVKELIKDKNVGAVISASNRIITDLLKRIDFRKAKILVEYGPGTGVITHQILNKMQEDATLFVFETNKEFINHLSEINDERLIVINADAEKALSILNDKYKVDIVDYIVSTIPFTFINKNKRRRIIYKSHKLLEGNGKFITYQYSWLIYRIIKTKFVKHNIKPILLNIPPAFVMEGVK